MKSKLTDLKTAVEQIPSGSSIALGGSILRRQPMAFVREMIRQGKKDLTILGYPCGLATDMLSGVGAVKRVESVYTGLFQFGMSYNFRRGVENGEIEIRDFSETAQCNRFRAAAMGVSFLPTKSLLGTDMARLNPDQVKEIVCPFTGEKYHAVPAAYSDFTVIHAHTADEYGNVQWPDHRDADDLDHLLAKASTRLFVTVEKIVPHHEIIYNSNKTFIPHNLVEAVIEVPFGAHPAPCDEYYDEDIEHLEYYQKCSKEPGRWLSEYAQKFIYEPKNHLEYLNRALTPERIVKISVK